MFVLDDGGSIDRLIAQVEEMDRRHLPYVIRQAINETAKKVLDAEQREMAAVFDNPTRWTLNAFYVKFATKQELVATIERKTAVGRRFYLEVQANGGQRRNTGIERAMISRLKYAGQIMAITPAAGMPRTAAGNMSPAAIQRIMSAVQVQGDRHQNTTKASRVRAKGRAQYFVPRPGSKLSPGVWARTSRRGGVKKVLHFTSVMPTYQRRFRFNEVAIDTAKREFEPAFASWMRKAIATAK